jgi:two-component system sensor histidine kinase/response regulator
METTILLVDDRIENIFALENILEKESRTFIHACSGAEAIQKVAECKPAIILLDYQMPGMSGLEVAELLRSADVTASIPILFITALTKNEYKKLQIFDEGTVEILSKPLDVAEVRNRVAVFEKLHHCQMLLAEHRALHV